MDERKKSKGVDLKEGQATTPTRQSDDTRQKLIHYTQKAFDPDHRLQTLIVDRIKQRQTKSLSNTGEKETENGENSFLLSTPSFEVQMKAQSLEPLPQSALWKDQTWQLPERYPYFTGRDTFLKRMEKALEGETEGLCVLTTQKKAPSSVTKIPQMTGAGGIGKTVLAVEYAYQAIQRKAYERVLWLDASQDLGLQYRDLARHLGVPFEPKTPTEEIIELVYRRLLQEQGSQSTTKVLLIFDNAYALTNKEDKEASLALYLPKRTKRKRFSVLITTRHDQRFGNEYVQFRLDVFTEAEAIAYLRKILEKVSEGDAAALAKVVHYYPLALGQAAAYIKHSPNSITVEDYIKAYQVNEQALLDTKLMSEEETYQRTLWLTLRFSIHAIKDEEAYRLMQYCAYLHSRNIPTFLLRSLIGKETKLSRLDAALGELQRYSVVERAGRGQVQMHAMVQSVLRLGHTTSECDLLRIILSAALTNEYNAGSDDAPLKKEHRQNALIEHLERLLKHFDRQPLVKRAQDKKLRWLSIESSHHDSKQKPYFHQGSQEKVLEWLLRDISAYDLSLGRARRALTLLTRLKTIVEQQFTQVGSEKRGEQLLSLASIQYDLASAYGAVGDPKSQKTLLEQALMIKEAHYGKAHWRVANLLASLGVANGDLGDIETKKSLLKRALSIQEIFYGRDHWQVALTLNDLANAYGSFGSVRKQKALLGRALTIMEAYYGKDHRMVGRTLNDLANACGDLGDAETKKELLERALLIQEGQYGKVHWQVAITLVNLGNACLNLGDAERAKGLMERALAIQEVHYGSDHWEVALTMSNLADVNGDLGDAKTKKEQLEWALPILEEHYGKTHWRVAIRLAALANAIGDLGDAQTKKERLEQALPILEVHYGPVHWQVATMLTNLGDAYVELGDAKKAKELLERALPIKEAHYGKTHRQVAHTLVILGAAHEDLGDAKRAKDLFGRALAIQEARYGKKHWELAITLVNLANANGDLGERKVQLTLLERALPIMEEHYGKDHKQVAVTLVNLANTYGALGDTKKKRALLEQVLPTIEAYYGKDHWQVAITSLNLALANIKLGHVQVGLTQLRTAYQRLLAGLGPQHPHTQKAKQLLVRLGQLPFPSSNLQPVPLPTTRAASVLSAESKQKQAALFKRYQNSKETTLPAVDVVLRRAVANGQVEDLKVLLQWVKVVNQQDNNPSVKRTALHWAVIQKQPVCLRLLVGCGARLDIKDTKGKVALDYCDKEDKEFTNFIGNVLPLYRAKQGHYQSVKEESQDALPGATVMLRRAVATPKGSLEDVRFLLNWVHTMDAQDDNPKSRFTALHWAVKLKKTEMIKVLLAAGARADITDVQGKTAEAYAREYGLALKTLGTLLSNTPAPSTEDVEKTTLPGPTK